MHKDIKLLLVNVINPQFVLPYPALNLVMLADYLIQHNVLSEKNIKIINTYYYDPLRVISVFKPHIIGCSVMTPSYDYAVELAKNMKKITPAILIIGGVHISGLPQALRYPFDIGVTGEGEQPLLEIINLYKQRCEIKERDLRKIMNVVYRSKNGKVTVNPMRPVLQSSDIPRLKPSLLEKEQFIEYMPIVKDRQAQLAKSANIFTARGCPYRCKFCSAQIIWPHKYGLRMFPAKRVGEEIEYLFTRHNINSIHIWDDTFAITKNRLKELIQELRDRNLLGKITFNQVYVRANLVDKEFVELLKEFGTVSVFMGFESGSDHILGYLKNYSLTVEQIRKAAAFFTRARIKIFGSFMLFSPGETIEDLQKSYLLANWLVSRHNVHIMPCVTCPFPGTELWNEAIKQKVIAMAHVQWNDFRVIQLSKKIPKVFFTNNLSHDIHMKYWLKFKALWHRSKRKRFIVRNFKKMELTAKNQNAELDRQMRQNLMYYETYVRFGRFIMDPLGSVKNIIYHPHKIKFIVKQTAKLFIPINMVFLIICRFHALR